jgi:predicted nucleotidyltransferase
MNHHVAIAIRPHRIAGVLCIALLGSLATTKPRPKDADLLVTVRDAADLVLLAAAGRKLKGHA